MITVKYDDIQEYLDSFVAEIHNYSGRGMYGKYCLGISFDDFSEFVRFVSELARNVAEDSLWNISLSEFSEVISEVSVDGFGLGKIYYWPTVKLEGYEGS